MNELKQKFEALCEGKPFQVEDNKRELLRSFHCELFTATQPIFKKYKLRSAKTKVWQEIASTVDIDYRVLKDYVEVPRTPQKRLMEKINVLVDLIKEKENQK